MTNYKAFTVHFFTPEKDIIYNNVYYVAILTQDGMEAFMHDHQDDSYMISAGICELKFVPEGEKQYKLDVGHAIFENNVLKISTLMIENV